MIFGYRFSLCVALTIYMPLQRAALCSVLHTVIDIRFGIAKFHIGTSSWNLAKVAKMK